MHAGPPALHPTQVADGDGWIAFFPGPFTQLTAGIDHTRVAPVIGCQWFTWQADDIHFRCVGCVGVRERVRA